MADCAVNSKLHYLKTDVTYNHVIWDNLVFGATKAVFGGNIRVMMSGAAPISSEVLDFLKIAKTRKVLSFFK